MNDDTRKKASLSHAEGASLVPVSYTSAFAARLQELIDSLGGLAKAGEVASVTDEQVARWRDGKSKPNLFGIAQIAAAAHRSVDWLLTGSEQPRRMPSGAAGAGNLPSDFRLIPRLDVQPAAGGGAVIEAEDPMEMLAFRSDWLHRRGVNPHAAHALTARGDSMEPTIRDGDILLVDTSIDRVVDNAIYVVVYDGRTLVKRVQLRRDGSVVLSSDNRAVFGEETVPAAEVPDLAIAGRVMWYGRSI